MNLKIKISSLALLCSLSLLGQTETNSGQVKSYDFSNVNLDEVDKQRLIQNLEEIRQLNDSIHYLLKTDSLYQLYKKLNTQTTKDYNSWYLSAGPSWSDLSALNTGLSNNNLQKVGSTGIDFSYVLAFAWKRKRNFHDLNMQFTFGGNDVQDSLRVDYSIIDILSYKYGYCLINSKNFALIPYAGINFRISNLNFENESIKKIPDNTDNYTDLTRLAYSRNDLKSTNFSNFNVPLDYGIELNYHIKYSRRYNGITLGARYGRSIYYMNTAWRNDETKLKNLPDIHLRESYLTFIVRFYWRRPDNVQIYPYTSSYF